MSKFKIGDRVIEYFDDYGKGTIVDIDDYDNYAVNFDEEIINGWESEDYNIADGHGWWLSEDDIELINENQTKYKFKIREYNYIDPSENVLSTEMTIEFDTIKNFTSFVKRNGVESYDKYLYGRYDLVDIYEMDDLEEQLEDYLIDIIERVNEFELEGEIE